MYAGMIITYFIRPNIPQPITEITWVMSQIISG
jgi:hypothetical protein